MAVIGLKGKRLGASGSTSPTTMVMISILIGIVLLQFCLPTRNDDIQSVDKAVASQARVVGQSAVEVPYDPLAIPAGHAQPLPSIRTTNEEEQQIVRKQYGGKGDKAHLGGFTELDLMGVSPRTWKFMIEYMGIKSMVDVGCGKGTSTSWFHDHGVDALCVEGSHDAVLANVLPNKDTHLVEHDFSRGPYWPDKLYDAVWAVEFLEHVGRNYQHNYIPIFRKAAYLFVTHSTWSGWHHVEVHDSQWWIARMESMGFKYSEELTKMVREVASSEREDKQFRAPNGAQYNAQHVWLHMMVFINPVVAARPEFARLMSQDGCASGRMKLRPCTEEGESKLPPEYEPIHLTPEMDEVWERRIFGKTTAEYEKEMPAAAEAK